MGKRIGTEPLSAAQRQAQFRERQRQRQALEAAIVQAANELRFSCLENSCCTVELAIPGTGLDTVQVMQVLTDQLKEVGAQRTEQLLAHVSQRQAQERKQRKAEQQRKRRAAKRAPGGDVHNLSEDQRAKLLHLPVQAAGK